MRFVFEYFKWHYTEAVVSIFYIIQNFLWFFYEFFSIPLLLRTLFMPFHRMQESYSRTFDFGKIFEAFIVNSLMRLVGLVLRLVLILLGIVCIVCAGVFGVLFLLAWLASPVLLLFLISYGIKLISIP